MLYTESAVAIQTTWRRFAAETQKNDIVYKAKVDKMCNKIRLISSEKEYWRQQVEELMKRNKLQRLADLDAQKKQLYAELEEKKDQIDTLESHYKDQLGLQDEINPRAIASGWQEQIKNNLEDTRKRITGAKLDLLFRIQFNLTKVERELNALQTTQNEAKQNYDHWANWHQVEQDRLWDFQRQQNKEIECRELRHAIVDEKLKWAVSHCVYSGKPDKRKPLVNGPLDNETVDYLIDGIKSKADEFQALQHATHTFKPFQKFWDSLSAAACDMGSRMPQTKSTTNGDRSQQNDAAPLPSSGVLNLDSTASLDQASLYPRMQAFPSKLPFHLLGKLQEERLGITSSLKPK
jgi:hypothetical protein